MMDYTIYITGAQGYIGSRLTALLPNINVIEGDILNTDFQNILRPGSILVHLAAKSDISESHKKPEEYHRVNVEGLKRVADACLITKTKLFFTSTVHVYGCPGPLIDETCTDLKGFSPYGETKIAGEKYIQELGKKGLKYTIFRFPGIFGYSPSIHFDTALNKFILQAIQKEPLQIWRQTWQKERPHLYIEDCTKAIMLFLEQNLFNNEIYNVITGNFTVETVINNIQEFVPDLEMSFVDAPAMNPSLCIDDTKIRALGFRPTEDLRAGIAETIACLKQRKQQNI